MEDEARLQAEKIVQRGREDIEKLKESALKEMEDKSLNTARDIAEAVLSEESKEALWLQLTNEVLDEIAGLPAEKFSLISEAVKLYSSHPLQEPQRERLRNIFKEKLGLVPALDEIIKKRAYLRPVPGGQRPGGGEGILRIDWKERQGTKNVKTIVIASDRRERSNPKNKIASSSRFLGLLAMTKFFR